MVFCLMFKFLSHFEFISVHDVRLCSGFIDLHAAVQFNQNHLLKRLFPISDFTFLPPFSFFLFLFFFFFFFLVFCLLRAAPVAYGGSQARGSVGTGSRQPIPQPQQRRILIPLSKARDGTGVLMDASRVL